MRRRLDMTRQVAWQGAVASTVATLLGMPIDMAMGRRIADMPEWPSLGAMCAGAGLLLWLVARSDEMSKRAISVAFLLNNLAVVLALWVTSGHFAASAPYWVPFQASKLSVLAVAMLTPPELFVGLTTIALFTAGAVLKFWTFDDSIRARLPVGEPWSMVAYAVFAVGLLIYRLRRKALENELFRAQAEADALEVTTRRLLAIQDLANTPLQTLEANTALLADIPGTAPYVGRMQRALARLQEWHRILRHETDDERWSGQHESFDARQVLAESQRQLKPGLRVPSPKELVNLTEAETGVRVRGRRR